MEEEEQKRFENYLKENLSIRIKSETNDFHSTDGSTKTCFTVSLLLNDKEISSDSYTS